KHSIEVLGPDVARSEERRSQELLDHDPGALVELLTEPRIGPRHAFPPPLGVVGLDARQDADLLGFHAERGPERAHEGQADEPQLDRADARHTSSAGRKEYVDVPPSKA